MNLDLGGGKDPANDEGTSQFAAVVAQLEAQDRLAAEAAERRKNAAQELKQLYGDFAGAIDKAAGRNKALMDSMRDGTFARQARDMAELNRQYEKMRREAELAARYGNRVGGFLARNEKAIGAAARVGGYAGAAALATGGGLVRQGFSGTVEQNRLDHELKMLSRELAGAFKPVIDVATKGTRALRQFMEGLGPAGQNVVMFSGLALTAATALKMLGLGGTVASGARALLTGGASVATTAATSAAASAATTVAASAGGSAAVTAASRSSSVMSRLGGAARFVGRNAKFVPYVGTAITAADAATGGDYGRMREAGKGRFASAMVAFAASSYDAYHELAPWEEGPNPLIKARKDWDKKHGRGGEDRRAVSIAGGGFDEAGSAYDRLNSAISMVEAENGTKDSATMAKAADTMMAAALAFKAAGERRDSPPLRRPGE